jgi:hypothetical protein
MRLLAAITGATLLFGALTVPVTAAASTPQIQVSRSTGLAGGDQVRLTARGFAPGSTVRIVQCDVFVDSFEGDCPDSAEVVAGSTGRIATTVTLLDPVFRQMEFGEPAEVYCRADICHLFAVGNDAAGNRLVLSTEALRFKGSPATITVSPATDLVDGQWVAVRGTARGAEGQQVQIVEHACYDIIQDTGCYGELNTVTTRVRSDGTYFAYYRVSRYLGDEEATDCTEPFILGECALSVTVLDRAGQPDNSFGYSPNGDMMALLNFRIS